MWSKMVKSAVYEESFFDWKQTLSGIDIEKFKNLYLDPAAGYTGTLGCPYRGECDIQECHGLYIRDLLAGTTACCTKKYHGPKIPVAKDDVMRYSLSYRRFHGELCKKLGLTLTCTSIRNFFWELGTYKRGTGRLLPVYISYYIVPDLLTDMLKELLATPDAQFLLVVFDSSMISRSAARLLEERKCTCVYMTELFTIDADCSLKLLTAPEHIFNMYKGEAPVLQQTYQCEVGTRWSDIYMKYENEKAISIWKRGSSAKVFGCEELGMAHKSTKEPTKAFNALCAMLEGEIDYIPIPSREDKKAHDIVTHMKKKLNEALMNFFPNIDDGEPIEHDKSTGYYRLKVNVKSPPPIY